MTTTVLAAHDSALRAIHFSASRFDTRSRLRRKLDGLLPGQMFVVGAAHLSMVYALRAGGKWFGARKLVGGKYLVTRMT